jgi:hypothetical protein
VYFVARSRDASTRRARVISAGIVPLGVAVQAWLAYLAHRWREEAIRARREAREMLARGGFALAAWERDVWRNRRPRRDA